MEKQKIVLFGCGKVLSQFLKVLDKKKNEIIGLCDNNEKLWGTEIKGYPVYPVDKIVELPFSKIIITVANSASIIKQLIDMGVPQGTILDFSPVYLKKAKAVKSFQGIVTKYSCMNYSLKNFSKVYKVAFWKKITGLSRKFASYSHKQLFLAEWSFDAPENFDHDIDLYWQWGEKGNVYWLERGIYNILALQVFEKPKLVELCCGEGFNAKYFYSHVADSIYSCDFDSTAIKEAKRKYQTKNVVYMVQDIRYDLKKSIYNEIRGGVTNVIWDAAIEHFTPDEINNIMKEIHEILSEENGILSGHTIVERPDGKSLEQHEYEFKSKEDLRRFFTPYFKNVTVFETIYKDRHNLYFYASDGILPFSDNWEHWINK